MSGLPALRRQARTVGLLLTAVLLLGTALAVSGPYSPRASAADADRVAAIAPVASPTARAPTAGDRNAPPTGTVRSPVVESVARQIAAHQLDGRNAFLPAPYVHTEQPRPGAAINPVPFSAPAPMGVADVGIGPGDAPYVYNTSAFQGTVDLSSYAAYSPGYAEFAEAPDWGTIQLNAVGVNLSYPGSDAGVFWFQNVVHFNGSEIELEDNLWNFTSSRAVITPLTLYSHNASGKVALAEYYYDYGPRFSVTYPFTLSLRLALAVVGGRPAAFLNYSCTGCSAAPGVHSYDELIFNGPATHTPQFEVNGGRYTPFGDDYDAELTFGGDGGGTNANLVALNGQATLDRWSAKAGRFVAVPSAYDHGVDSGETVTGVATHYLATTEYLEQGPSFLYGLWNTTSSPAGPAALPGWIQVSISVTPIYAILFATNESLDARPATAQNFTYAPTNESGVAVTELPPPRPTAPYVFQAWADGYLNQSTPVTGNGSLIALKLTRSAGLLDAPVYLRGDAQATAFGKARDPATGYAAAGPTLWINLSEADLAPVFLRLNAFDYPTFVLFSAEDLNLSVHLDAFVQEPDQSGYTSSYNYYPLPVGGWVQGYYFFGGRGTFSVDDVAVTGNTTLYYDGFAPPAAVDFFGTTDSRAVNVTSAQESFGVASIDSVGARMEHVESVKGANGVSLVNSTGTVVTDLTAVGTDYTGYPSYGAFLYNASYTTIDELNASGGSVGAYAQSSANLTVVHLLATTSALSRLTTALGLNDSAGARVEYVHLVASEGLIVNGSSDGSYSELSASASPLVGAFTNSSTLTVESVGVANASTGLEFVHDSAVTVDGVIASVDSTGVVAFTSSEGGTFEDIQAEGGSIGVNATNASRFSIEQVAAVRDSLGAVLYFDAEVTVEVGSAAANSTAVFWDRGSNGSIGELNASAFSVGADIENVTNVTVHAIRAFNTTLAAPAGDYQFDPFTLTREATAAVALWNDSRVRVENVSATDYPFAVWANYTTGLVIQGVTAWNGFEAIALNATSGEVAGLFSYGASVGVYLANTTSVVVTGSTIEASASFGLVIDNSTTTIVYANNFVGNNGADVKGTYSDVHIQAESINGTDNYFYNGTVGNYWADHSGAGDYVIRVGNATVARVADTHPEPAFISYWAEFEESGLPAGTAWGFDLAGQAYPSTEPLVYVPSWSLTRAPHPYTAFAVAGYLARPASGTLPGFTGDTNRTVTIEYAALYTVTFAETGLPLATEWSVSLNGTVEKETGATTSVVFSEPAGSYGYSIAGVPGWTESALAHTGTVTVSDADVTEKTLAFTRVTYKVTFTAVGLSGKAIWGVTLNGTPTTGPSATLSFTVPNGSFSYTISAPAGFTAGPSKGTVTVNGGAAGVTVDFNATATTSPSSSSPTWLYIGIGAAAAAVVAGAVAAVLVRRRRRARPPPTTEDAFDR